MAASTHAWRRAAKANFALAELAPGLSPGYCGAFHGVFQSVLGAILPQNDVGMAKDYLRLPPAAKITAALLALAIIAVVSIRFTHPLLELAPHRRDIDTPGARTRFIFRVATLPALLALGQSSWSECLAQS